MDIRTHDKNAAIAEDERLRAELGQCISENNQLTENAAELGKALDLALAERDAAFAEVDALRAELDAMRRAHSVIAARMEKHVCPLPIDIVKRLIVRYSNPGEIILDPFTGIGTVPATAIELGRKGWGAELNPLYFDIAAGYCKDAEVKASMPTLFEVAAD